MEFLQEAVIMAHVRYNAPLPDRLIQGFLMLTREAQSAPTPEQNAHAKQRHTRAGPGEWTPKTEELVASQYDQPMGIFENVLGATMKYTMALWSRGAETLDEAQRHMMDDLCDKLQIRDGQHVVDVGCGFGSFAEHVLTRFPSCRVTGINISQVQMAHIRRKARDPRHPFAAPHRFRLIEHDMSTFQPEEPYDRLISIGVFEHVKDCGAALRHIRGWLRDDGLALIHMIAKRHKVAYFRSVNRFISRHIFPGGQIHSHHTIPADCDEDSGFALASAWFLESDNYRRTCQAWLDATDRSWGRILETGVSPENLRLWRVYLVICVGVFAADNMGNGQYLLRPRPRASCGTD